MCFPREILSRTFSQRTTALIHFLKKLLQHYFVSTLANAHKIHAIKKQTLEAVKGQDCDCVAVYFLGDDFALLCSELPQREAGFPAHSHFPNSAALRDTEHPFFTVWQTSSKRRVPSSFASCPVLCSSLPTVRQSGTSKDTALHC